jgi:16S rRNA processing protein RimM
MRNLDDWIEAGVIVRAHGVRGEVVADVLQDLAEVFAQGLEVRLTDGEGAESRHQVRRARRHQDRLILELSGVDTCERAEDLRACTVWLSRDSIAPLEGKRWFVQDLLGVEVFTEEGELLGRLTEVMHMPANDVYVVRGKGGEILLPAIDEVIREVDLDAGRMLVRLIEGLR